MIGLVECLIDDGWVVIIGFMNCCENVSIIFDVVSDWFDFVYGLGESYVVVMIDLFEGWLKFGCFVMLIW